MANFVSLDIYLIKKCKGWLLFSNFKTIFEFNIHMYERFQIVKLASINHITHSKCVAKFVLGFLNSFPHLP